MKNRDKMAYGKQFLMKTIINRAHVLEEGMEMIGINLFSTFALYKNREFNL